MKNAYYIEYTNDFANTYNLWYAPAGAAVPEGLERITRRFAEQKCRSERDARRYDPDFSGYGDTHIYPISCRGKMVEPRGQFHGYIVHESEICTWEM